MPLSLYTVFAEFEAREERARLKREQSASERVFLASLVWTDDQIKAWGERMGGIHARWQARQA